MKCHVVRHEKHCKMQQKLICENCGKYETVRANNMKKHHLVCFKRLTDGVFDDDDDVKKTRASSSNSSQFPVLCKVYTCDICRRPHGNMSELIQHRNVHSAVPTGIPTALSNDFASIHLAKHAFGAHVCEYDLKSHETCSDVLQFFQMSAALVSDLIRSLSSAYFLKGRMVARARYFKVNDRGQRVEEIFLFFPSHPLNVIDSDGEEWYTSHSKRIIELMDTMNRNASNIEFDCIERVYIKLTLQDNVNGRGIFTLPPMLGKKKQTIVNVETESECFKYALLSVLHYNDVLPSSEKIKRPMRSGSGSSILVISMLTMLVLTILPKSRDLII